MQVEEFHVCDGGVFWDGGGGVYRFFGMMNGYPAVVLVCFGEALGCNFGELVGYIDGRASAR